MITRWHPGRLLTWHQGLFLDYKSDLIILVVNTLTQDLKSDNYLVGEPLSPEVAATRCCAVLYMHLSSFSCGDRSRYVFSIHPQVRNACTTDDSCFFDVCLAPAVCTALAAVCKLIGPGPDQRGACQL